MMTQAEALGLRLMAARRARGMPRHQVGELLKKRENTIYRYEMGRLEPSYQDLATFALIYGVTVAALVDPQNAKTALPTFVSPGNRGPVALPPSAKAAARRRVDAGRAA